MLGSSVGIQGQWRRVKLVGAKVKPDMALFSLDYPGNLRCIPLGASPAIGSRVKLVGFPGGGRLSTKYGTVVNGTVTIGGVGVRSGFSGGAVYNTTGDRRLAGIIWGSTGYSTVATSPVVLAEYVRNHLGTLPRCNRPFPGPNRPPAVPAPPTEESPPAPPVEDEPPKPRPTPSLFEKKLSRLEQRVDDLKRDVATIRLQKGEKGDKGDKGDPGNVTELNNVVAAQQQLIEKLMGRLSVLEAKRIHVAIKEQSGAVTRQSFAGTGDDPIRLQLPTKE